MDRKLYEFYVKSYADALYRFSLRLFRENESAKDAVQESFLRLWQSPEEIHSPKSYLFTTLYRVFLDAQKQKKNQEHYSEQVRNTDNIPMNFPFEQKERMELIEQALQKLPPIQKTLIMLRDYEGYSYQEIGRITHLSEAQVKTYIFRGRNSLRKYIGKPETITD